MLTRDTIYVQVFLDRFVMRNVESSQTIEIRRDPKYASPRTLIGHFTSAEAQVREGIKRLRRRLLSPLILMHPMELTQGGVTQVERRALMEAGYGSGGHKVGVWEGEELTGARVRRAVLEFKDV